MFKKIVLWVLTFYSGMITVGGAVALFVPGSSKEPRIFIAIIDLLFACLTVCLFKKAKTAKTKNREVVANQQTAQKGEDLFDLPEKTFFDIKMAHVDPSENIATPAGAEISFLDAQALEFWDKKKTDYEIPPYYSDNAFGRNVAPALQRLLDGGYLEICGVEERIKLNTIPELKAVLADREIKTSGKKGELVQRVLDNFMPDEIEEMFPVGFYKITDKGRNALKPYSIIKLDQQYSLGLSYYRLLQEKSNHPEDEDEIIISRILSEDIQRCYEQKDKSTYQRLLPKVAMFANGSGEPQTALECYCLAFFVWTREIEDYSITSGSTQSYYMAKEIEDCGKLCGMSLGDIIEFFYRIIQEKNPFMEGTKRNVQYAVNIFKTSLSIK